LGGAKPEQSKSEPPGRRRFTNGHLSLSKGPKFVTLALTFVSAAEGRCRPILADRQRVDLDLAQNEGGLIAHMAAMANPWATVSGAQDAIIGQALDGTIASWNAGAERLLGYSANEALGRSAALLAAGPRSQDLLAAIQRIQRGERVPPYEDEFRCKDGSVLLVSVAMSPVMDGPRQFRGISQIVRPVMAGSAQAVLRPAEIDSKKLDGESLYLARLGTVGQTATALVQELTQPLTAIAIYLTAARRLLLGDETRSALDLTTAIDRAYDQANRAAQIIRALRPFLSDDNNERQHVPIRAVIIEASELALIAARQAGVEVGFQRGADALVLINRIQIQQVVFSLIRNAVEMSDTPSGGVRVSTARTESHIVVSIAGTGPLFPPDVAARLFQPFETTKADGVGVGLSNCRTIIAAHGGELWLGSEEPGGATFHFKLPLPPMEEYDFEQIVW
jgi:two-component system, LuxR family, sensor kinase FixL